jgi:3'-phosphoadenosine 5'-phosphosulfate sulfotransferase (PAPS reductase)/FAD synthetase
MLSEMYIQDMDLKLKDWQFAQRKYLPWETKQELTDWRIMQWYDHWDGMVYASFSGGLDSRVMLHKIRKLLGSRVPAVFIDTGLEFPELKKFVGTFDNVDVRRPEMSYKKVLETHGYPLVSKETAMKIRKLRHGNLSDKYRNYLLNGDERGKFGKLSDKWKFLLDAPFDVSEKCCDVMKKKPLKQYAKETDRYPFIGITQDEGFKRQRLYEKTGCNAFDSSEPQSKPIGFWTRQDTLRYVVENDLEIASVYGDIVYENGIYRTTGEQRTGCIFCAFGCHLEECPNRFQRLQVTHPELWDYCMHDRGLGMATILRYSGIPFEVNTICQKDATGANYEQFILQTAV